MRKRILSETRNEPSSSEHNWLDLERLTQVELTSEEPDSPIESALDPLAGGQWRASAPGEQTIRLLFDQPQDLRRISLLFIEEQQERTQELALAWTGESQSGYREIARQQFNFSPQAATRELEEYAVDLAGVTVLEVRITPNISGGDDRASLAQLRVA
jgi:hypothetical protein